MYFLVSIKSQYRYRADVSIKKALIKTAGIVLGLFILRIRPNNYYAADFPTQQFIYCKITVHQVHYGREIRIRKLAAVATHDQ